MAGSPLKRARRAGVRLADGSVITFPLLNRPRAGLTHGQWRMLSPAERIERQLGSMGLSLDQCCEIVSWPWEFGDPADGDSDPGAERHPGAGGQGDARRHAGAPNSRREGRAGLAARLLGEISGACRGRCKFSRSRQANMLGASNRRASGGFPLQGKPPPRSTVCSPCPGRTGGWRVRKCSACSVPIFAPPSRTAHLSPGNGELARACVEQRRLARVRMYGPS